MLLQKIQLGFKISGFTMEMNFSYSYGVIVV